MATGNNGKYLAVRRSTKWAKNIILTRPKKLEEAIKKYKVKVPQMEGFANEKQFLESLTDNEITMLFDNLKEKYGRDIFGKGYIYRMIDDGELADVDKLSEEEKNKGIDPSKNFYVPYDKGDKDGNRWFLETPYAIAWTKENVSFLKKDPKARYQGYTFYFREGFCWILTLNESSEYQKARIKEKTVNDVNAMALYPFKDCGELLCYFICLINSYFIFQYKRNFISSNSAFQINDARQLPIIIPNKEQIDKAKRFVDEAIRIKKTSNSETELHDLQKRVDEFVEDIYQIRIKDNETNKYE